MLIPPRELDGPAPLSFGQQRMWFLDRLGVGAQAYNVPTAFRVKGPLDVAALERSLNRIIQRHAILRTTFVELDGEPRQVVAPELSVAGQPGGFERHPVHRNRADRPSSPG